MRFPRPASLPAALVLVGLSPLAHAQAPVVFVDRTAEGAATGSSWADAFTDLQQGLAAAASLAGSGGVAQVWVADGTYAPTGPGGPRTASFVLRDGVGLYGGFAGGETAFAQRDPAAHATVLSGDFAGDDLPAWVNHGNNSYHVVLADGVGPSAVLDGFTVRGGYAEDAFAGHASGGGLRALDGAPTVAHCTFTDNHASSGAGLLLSGATGASLTHCTISANLAQPFRGGGVYAGSGAGLLVEDCSFTGNRAVGFSSPSDAGAVWIDPGTAVTIRRCLFTGNSTTNPAVNMDNGGAICNLSDLLVLDACVFAGNAAEVGGAVWNGGDTVTSNCTFTGNTAVVGGGLMNFFNTTVVTGCSFAGNFASDGGGAMANNFSPQVLVRNSVLWGNASVGQPTLKAQIHNLSAGTVEIRWSDVQGLFETIPGEDPPDPADYPGCLAADPLFVDVDGADNVPGTADDDVTLLAASPCRDAGSNGFVPPGHFIDAAGAPRFRDDPLAPDLGAGAPPLVDMGALEAGSLAPWAALGDGLPGALGLPRLYGAGALLAGSPGALDLAGAAVAAPAVLLVSLSGGAAPFKGGVLLAFPPALMVTLATDGHGTAHLAWSDWPAGISGATLAFQAACPDAGAVKGVSLSEGRLANVP